MTLYALDGTGNRLSGGAGEWTHIALMATARSRTLTGRVPGDRADSAGPEVSRLMFPLLFASLTGRWATTQRWHRPMRDQSAESPEKANDTLQVDHHEVVYQDGVGSGTTLRDKVFGGLTGAGTKRRTRRLYAEVCDRYAKPNATAEDLTIDIIGFSRGGAAALHLANVIYAMGIRKPRPAKWWQVRKFNSWRPYRTTFGWIWFRDWPRLDPASVAEIEDRVTRAGLPENQVKTHEDIVVPRIRFLGLFDAVSSFAVPVDTRFIDIQALGLGFRLQSPPNVGMCSHAMALDERRKTFRNLRVDPAKAARPKARRSKEVGAYAVGVMTVLLALGVLALLPGVSLGVFRVPAVIAYLLAVVLAFGHGMAGSSHDTEQRDAAQTALDRVRGFPVAVIFAMIAAAVIELFGGFDIESLGTWHYLGAAAWAFVTLVAASMLSSQLGTNTTAVRTSDEVFGLAARRVNSIAAIAAWGLATGWLIGATTDWWSYGAADRWLWITLLWLICLVAVASLLSSQRPGAQRARAAKEVAPQTSGFVGFVAALGIAGAWGIRTLVNHIDHLDVQPVPWWNYLVVACAAAVLLWLGRRRHQAHATEELPPSLGELSKHFRTTEVRELWFRGNHTDIGGGGAPELCQHALQWMTDEAERADLHIDLQTIERELAQRVTGSTPRGVGPTADPFVSTCPRPILAGDVAHASFIPPTATVPELPQDTLMFNLRRWTKGVKLAYDPNPERKALSRAVAERLHSPHPERFVAAKEEVADVEGEGSQWLLAGSNLVSQDEQQNWLDLQANGTPQPGGSNEV